MFLTLSLSLQVGMAAMDLTKSNVRELTNRFGTVVFSKDGTKVVVVRKHNGIYVIPGGHHDKDQDKSPESTRDREDINYLNNTVYRYGTHHKIKGRFWVGTLMDENRIKSCEPTDKKEIKSVELLTIEQARDCLSNDYASMMLFAHYKLISK